MKLMTVTLMIEPRIEVAADTVVMERLRRAASDSAEDIPTANAEDLFPEGATDWLNLTLLWKSCR